MTKSELKAKTDGVILDVLITEKGSRMSAEGRYLLKVAPDARKPHIAAAAEKAFGVRYALERIPFLLTLADFLTIKRASTLWGNLFLILWNCFYPTLNF